MQRFTCSGAVGDRTFKRSLLSGVASFASGAVASLAMAGGAVGQEEASSASSNRIDTIVITARKRSESLQEVPIAVTAVTEAQLDRTGSTEIVDLANSVPNFTFNGSGNTLAATGIRGIVAATRNIGFESGMGVYIDEVYVGRPSAFNQNLDDVQQVEVLRGPQGTLYGRNTIAGAINITTKEPTNELEGRLKATVGDRERFNVSGFVSGPIIEDVLRAKLSLYSVQREGYVENAFDDSLLNDEDRQGYRASLYFTPTENLEFVLSADDMRERTNRTFTVFRQTDVTSPLAGLYNVVLADDPCCQGVPNLTSQDGDPREDRDLSGQSLRATYELDSGYSIISISSFRQTDFEIVADDDATPLPTSLSTFADESDLFTQELRIESPADRRFSYVAGLYYQDTESSASRQTAIATPAPFSGIPNFTNGAGFPITDADGNIIEPIGAISSSASVEAESYAVFGSLDFDLTDQLTTTFGLRYTSEEKSLDFVQTNTSFTGQPNVVATPSIDDEGVSGNLSLAYQLNDQVNVYGSFARGFKSGGFNPDIVPNDDIAFGEETVDTFEIGVKSQLLDNRLRLNSAVFFSDYKDQQVQRLGTSPVGGTGFQITNADSEILGFELEATAILFENLQIGGSLGLLDHEYTEFADCSATEDNQLDENGQFILLDCTGNELSYVPDVTYSINGEYTIPANIGDFFVRAEYNFKGEHFSEPGNFERTAIPDADITNVRIGFSDRGGRFELAAFGRNVADNENLQFSWYIPAFQTSYQSFGIGSEYGVDLIVNF